MVLAVVRLASPRAAHHERNGVLEELRNRPVYDCNSIEGEMIFPPDGHPESQPSEGIPILRTIIVWVSTIATVLFCGEMIAFLAIGITAKIMGWI